MATGKPRYLLAEFAMLVPCEQARWSAPLRNQLFECGQCGKILGSGVALMDEHEIDDHLTHCTYICTYCLSVARPLISSYDNARHFVLSLID